MTTKSSTQKTNAGSAKQNNPELDTILDASIKAVEENLKTLQKQNVPLSDKDISQNAERSDKSPKKDKVTSENSTSDKIYKTIKFGSKELVIRNKSKKINDKWETTNDLVSVLQNPTNLKDNKDYLRSSALLELLEFLLGNIELIDRLRLQEEAEKREMVKNVKKITQTRL